MTVEVLYPCIDRIKFTLVLKEQAIPVNDMRIGHIGDHYKNGMIQKQQKCPKYHVLYINVDGLILGEKSTRG